jgi:hypothetical protein
VHEITDNSLSQEPQLFDRTIEMEEAQSDHLSTPEARGELDLWEESMQKVAKKLASRQSSDLYRSEERDQVALPDSPPQKDIADFTSEQELEQYIRDKYSEYFAEKEAPKSPSHHHTSSLDKQLFEKKVMFAEGTGGREE